MVRYHCPCHFLQRANNRQPSEVPRHTSIPLNYINALP